MADRRIAALFVLANGPYAGLPNVDVWDEARDARTYAGPWPVVAHPPCAAWGAYSKPTPGSTARGPLRGDDGGTFAAALAAVREWGGVLEHPALSHAWDAHGLPRPLTGPQWMPAMEGRHRGGRAYVVEVDQGAYGHEAQKRTWLYAVTNGELPDTATRAQEALPVSRRAGDSPRRGNLERMSRLQRLRTPLGFRDVLLAVAAAAGLARRPT